MVGSRVWTFRGVMSSSESSAMLSMSIKLVVSSVGRASSRERLGLARAAGGGRDGLAVRTGECEGEAAICRVSYSGRERVRAMGGAESALTAEWDLL